MSLPDPKAKLHLQGQDSEEARQLVAAQRDLKKKKDQLRKLASKLKAEKTEEGKAAIAAEIAATEAEIASLEKSLAPPAASQDDAAQEVVAATNPEAPVEPSVHAPSTSEVVTPPYDVPAASSGKFNTHLQGQDSEEARQAVAAQRDLKKKKDQLRKLASKLKAEKTEEGKAAIAAEIAATEAEISVLEKPESQAPAVVTHPQTGAQQPSAPVKVAAAPTAPATVSPQPPKTSVLPSVTPSNPSVPSMVALLSPKPRLSTPLVQSVGQLPSAVATPSQSGRSVASSAVFRTQQPDSPLTPVPEGHFVEPPKYSMIHPRIAELGLLCQSMQLVGGNARTIAFLDAITELAKSTPVLNVATFSAKERKELEKVILENFKFLSSCREPCAGMSYVKSSLIRRLSQHNHGSNDNSTIATPQSKLPPFDIKMAIRRNDSMMLDAPSSPVTVSAPAAFHSRSLPATSSRFTVEPLKAFDDPDTSSSSASKVTLDPYIGTVRDHILSLIDEVKEEIFRSIHSLVEERAQAHIKDGDCILTYGRSSSVEMILQRAVSCGRKISVVVVDSGPLYEGKELAWRLQRLGLEVTYGLITSICVLLPKCTKVFIGASAVLQSGEVYSRCGTGMVAAAAKCFRKPVLCMCESHKFVPKVWIGSLVQNSDVSNAQQRHPIIKAKDVPVVPKDCEPNPSTRHDACGYLYDLTPASYVDMVVCEMGCLHTSAIAAAIRDREDRELLLWQQ